MESFTDVGFLYTVLRESSGSGSVIGVEGHSTSGKSTLARLLGAHAEAVCLSSDDYVDQRRDADTYPEFIESDRLRADVTSSQRLYALTFVEGICLRDILGQVGVRPTGFIYCKRITAAGLWADDPDNYVKDGAPIPGLSWVDLQSVEYHIREDPLRRANWIYAWHEE